MGSNPPSANSTATNRTRRVRRPTRAGDSTLSIPVKAPPPPCEKKDFYYDDMYYADYDDDEGKDATGGEGGKREPVKYLWVALVMYLFIYEKLIVLCGMLQRAFIPDMDPLELLQAQNRMLLLQEIKGQEKRGERAAARERRRKELEAVIEEPRVRGCDSEHESE